MLKAFDIPERRDADTTLACVGACASRLPGFVALTVVSKSKPTSIHATTHKIRSTAASLFTNLVERPIRLLPNVLAGHIGYLGDTGRPSASAKTAELDVPPNTHPRVTVGSVSPGGASNTCRTVTFPNVGMSMPAKDLGLGSETT